MPLLPQAADNNANAATLLPVLFVAHGSPNFALSPGEAGAAYAALAATLPRPRAILIVSAHWSTERVTVGVAETLSTIHDFYGFSEELHGIDYPARSDPALGEWVRSLLQGAGFEARIDEQRGLDHGAWIPLRQMFPEADIPVITLSLQAYRGTEHHQQLGAALAALPAAGVLIVASGNLTHNLADYRGAMRDDAAPEYVRQFAEWVWMQLQRGSTEALVRYRSLAPEAARAHPSEEHLLPLHVALGAAGNNWRAERLHSGIDEHVLAMDSFAFWPAAQKERQGERA
jgi:4,5-DOPA dioxygenase extradiol